MATITVTPLNNGIPATPPLIGMLALAGVGTAYIYVDSLGNVYHQSSSTSPTTLILASGIAITCMESAFNGTDFNIFLGSSGGQYVWGAIDQSGANTLAIHTYGVHEYTSVVFDSMLWGFTVGTSTGLLIAFDLASNTPTILEQLTSLTAVSPTTLKVSDISYDLTTNKYLIATTLSTNLNPDYADPVDVAAKALLNSSTLFYGALGSLTPTNITARHLPYCALGVVQNPIGLKVPKLVSAGEDCRMYHSDDGIVWTPAISVDQALPLTSLAFKSWVFVAGLPYGVLMLSTNGAVWESAYDQALSADIVTVIPA